MLHRARCSVCGLDYFAFPNKEEPPCRRCGGETFVFVPGPMVLKTSWMLVAAVFFGYFYWIQEYFRDILHGRINYIPNNIVALSELAVALILLFLVTMAGIYSLQSFRGSLYKTIIAGVLVSASFGYGVSMVLGPAVIVLSVLHRKQYYV